MGPARYYGREVVAEEACGIRIRVSSARPQWQEEAARRGLERLKRFQ